MINVRTDGKSPTLRAEMHGNIPCVMQEDRGAKGFDGYNGCITGDVSSTIGVNCGMSTGRTGVIVTHKCIENHPADSRVTIDDSGKCQTLTSRMGTGGGNVPMILEQHVFRKTARPTSKDTPTVWKEGGGGEHLEHV